MNHHFCHHERKVTSMCLSEKCSERMACCSQECLSIHSDHGKQLVELKELCSRASQQLQSSSSQLEQGLDKVISYYQQLKNQLYKVVKSLEEQTIMKIKNASIIKKFDKDALLVLQQLLSKNYDSISKSSLAKLRMSLTDSIPNKESAFSWQIQIPAELPKKMKQVVDSIKTLAIPVPLSQRDPKVNIKDLCNENCGKPLQVLQCSRTIGKLVRKKGQMRLLTTITQQSQNSQQGITNEECQGTLFECLKRAVRDNIASIQLIYRASQHNFQTKYFKKACLGVANTLVLIKSGKQRIFGGYSPCPWPNVDSYVADDSLKSFVFSINAEANTLYKYTIRPHLRKYAISSYSTWGPIYGSPYGPDLAISVKCDQVPSHSTMGSYYQLPEGISEYSKQAKQLLCGEQKFLVQDYQIYQLKMK